MLCKKTPQHMGWRNLARLLLLKPQRSFESPRGLGTVHILIWEYSLEGWMLKLKLQYSGHLMWRMDSLEKTLMLGKTKGGRRRGRQRMRWLDGITGLNGHEFEQAPEFLMDRDTWQSMGSQRVGYDWMTELNYLEKLVGTLLSHVFILFIAYIISYIK